MLLVIIADDRIFSVFHLILDHGLLLLEVPLLLSPDGLIDPYLRVIQVLRYGISSCALRFKSPPARLFAKTEAYRLGLALELVGRSQATLRR